MGDFSCFIDPETIYWLSVVMIRIGDSEGGLDMFHRAIDSGYYPYPAFKIEPWLDPVRDRPAFQESMEKAMRKHEAFRAKYF